MTNQYQFALLGDRIDYSQSPHIFEAIFEHLKITGSFTVVSVEREQMPARLRQLLLDGCRGISVTIPHKEDVIPHLDDIGPVAQALGAVNSIWIEDGRMYGYNTDCYGFSMALQKHRATLEAAPIVVLGCGGAARAAIYALYKDYNIRELTLAGRSPENLHRAAKMLESQMAGLDISPVAMNSNLHEIAREAALIVNGTPLGGWNHADAEPLPAGFDFSSVGIYYDLNYNADNKCMQAAREAEIIAIDGSAMLVGQAIRSFDIWTGQSVEFKPIYDAVFSTK